MPAVNVATVRIEENRFLVWRERPLLDFAVARCEQLRSSTVGGKRVQMLPAVLFRSDHQLIAGGPIDDAAAGIARHIGVGSLRCGTAMPDFFCRACRRVGGPDRPRMRLVRHDEISLRCVSRFRRPAYEGNAFPVERPYRITIAIHRRRDVTNAPGSYVVNGDEGVIAASGDERQLSSIRRPLWIRTVASHHNLFGLLTAIERGDPDFAVFVVGYPAFGGNLCLAAAFIDFSWRAAFPIHGPQSHLRPGGIAGWISVLPGGIFLLTAHVDDHVG